MREGQVEEHGEVLVELPELQEAWQHMTGRAMPDTGSLRSLLRTLRRWSLCREVDSEPDDPQPFRILVRPAIVEIAGPQDRKSTRLNSSHVKSSYAVFCL